MVLFTLQNSVEPLAQKLGTLYVDCYKLSQQDLLQCSEWGKVRES